MIDLFIYSRIALLTTHDALQCLGNVGHPVHNQEAAAEQSFA